MSKDVQINVETVPTSELRGAVLYSDVEIAKMFGLKAGLLRSMRMQGEGPRYLKFSNKCVRYRVSDMEDWIAAHIVDPVR